MSGVWITTKQLVNSVVAVNRYVYYHQSVIPNYADLIEMADQWEAGVGGVVNAMQHQGVENVSITVAKADDGGFSFTRGWAGGGLRAVAVTSQSLRNLAVNFRLFVGGTFVYPSDLPYSGSYPVRSGRKFIAGVTDDMMSSGVYNPEATPLGLINDVAEAMRDFELTPTLAGVPFVQIVPGHANANRPQELYALVADVQAVGISSLQNRKN